MALSLAGAPVRLIPWGRPAGTVVVGASTGLQFTATVVAKLVTLLPLIIAAAFLSTIVGAIGGLLYMRLGGGHRTTAFFATVPGGVVETTNLAPRYGGGHRANFESQNPPSSLHCSSVSRLGCLI